MTSNLPNLPTGRKPGAGIPAAIFAVALVLRVVYLIQAQSHPLHTTVWGVADSIYYHLRGVAFAGGEVVAPTAFFLGPLYHYLIGVVYVFTGPNAESVKIVQCLLGAFSCVQLYWLGRRIFSERVAIAAALVLAFYGLHLYYAGLLLPTTLVLVTNLWFLLVMIPPQGLALTARRCVYGGFVLGLAALAKSNALLALPVVMVALWWFPRDASRRWRALRSAAVALGLGIALLPAVAHNYAATGEFVLINTTGGRNVWKGNGPHANGTHVFLPRGEGGTSLRRYLIGQVDPKVAIAESSDFTSMTVSYMAEDPWRSVQLFLKKGVLMFNAVELGVRDQFYFAKSYAPVLALPLPAFAVVVPLGLAGLALSWRRRERLSMIYALLLVQVASFVAVFVLARYRIVMVALLALFAAELVFAALEDARGRRWRRLGGALALVAALAVFVNWPVAGFGRERGFALQYQRLGTLYLSQRQYEDALTAFEKALGRNWQEKDPLKEESVVRLRMARAQAGLGHDAEARATVLALREALDRERDVPEFLYENIDAFLAQLESGSFESEAPRDRP